MQKVKYWSWFSSAWGGGGGIRLFYLLKHFPYSHTAKAIPWMWCFCHLLSLWKLISLLSTILGELPGLTGEDQRKQQGNPRALWTPEPPVGVCVGGGGGHFGPLSHVLECVLGEEGAGVQLGWARESLRRAASWPAGSRSVSPNLGVKGKSVFLKIHSTELRLLQIVSLSLRSWNLNWLCYFCHSCWKFCPFSSCSASSMSAALQMRWGFVVGTKLLIGALLIDDEACL